MRKPFTVTKALRSVSAALFLGAMAMAPVHAEDWPTKPIRLVVPAPPGGITDGVARLIAHQLQTNLGQAVIVDNKPGGSAVIAERAVMNTPSDGYTLMVSPASFLTTNKSIFKSLPYDPEADFAPISKLVNQPMVLVVKDKQKFPSVAAVVSAAKTAPGKLTFASSGDGSPQHLAALMFETRTHAQMLHVPYKGGAPAVNDTLAGNVDMLFAVLPEVLPHIQAGKLHALGLLAPKRTATLPNTPTMVESGFADLNLSAWVGLFAPAKTPQPIIDKLNRAVRAALDSDIKTKLSENGMEIAPSTPEQLKQTLSQDIKLHAELVKAAGIQPQ